MESLQFFKDYTLKTIRNPELYQGKVDAMYMCGKVPLERIRMVYFDIETSPQSCTNRPNVSADTIIEIAGVDINDATFSELCNPGHDIYNSEIHGISNKDVMSARPTRDVLLDFLTWVRDSDHDVVMLIGHNASNFDSKVLQAHIKRYDIEQKLYQNIVIGDTLYPAKKLSGCLSGSLENIFKHMFDANYIEEHRALQDSIDLKRIMSELALRGKTTVYSLLHDYIYSLSLPDIKKQNRVYLSVPYDMKDDAKSKGAKWDKEKRLWYSESDKTHALLIATYTKVT